MDEATTETVPAEAVKKRKPYAPRQGIACPQCKGPLRSVYITLNEGGIRLIPMHGGCPKCAAVYSYGISKVPEVVK